MSIPAPSALVRHQVTWPIGWAGGTAGPLAGARGHVTFEASATVIAYSQATVLPEAVTTPVVGGVMAPVTLIENDPEVWNWKVTPRLGVAWEPFHIDVTGPVNVASAATTPGKGPVRVVKGDQGYQGKSVSMVAQVSETLLRLDLDDPATGEQSVEYFELARGPEGPYGGTEITAPQVASMVSTDGTVRDALAQSYGRGYSVKDWGATGDGVTDDTLQIQAAADAVASYGVDAVLYFPEGVYRTSETLVLSCSLDASAATISYTGTGTAVTLGDDRTPGTVTFRKSMRAPRVVCASKPATGWTADAIGIRTVNLNACDVYLPYVQHFGVGILMYGLAAGNAYNTFTLGAMECNRVNLSFDADATGWVNQSVFIGGRFQHHSVEGANVSGVRHLLINSPSNPVNNNLFLNPSFEGNTPEFHLDMGGTANLIMNGRYEVAGGARVRWRSGATQNQIMYGYQAINIAETWDAGAHPSNNLLAGQGGHTATGFPNLLQQTAGPAAAIETIMGAGALSAKADPETAYAVRRSTNDTRMKRPDDEYDRVLIDHVNGRVSFGTGLTAPPVGVGIAGPALRLDTITRTTAAQAGGAAALPETPAGYMGVYVAGGIRYIPYY